MHPPDRAQTIDGGASSPTDEYVVVVYVGLNFLDGCAYDMI